MYAWLNTTIEKEETTRLEKYLDDEDAEFEMPPLTLPSLFNTFLKIHPYEYGAMGATPLSWQTIESYQNLHGIELKSWELGIIRQASREYVAQMQVSAKADCPSPVRIIVKDPDAVAKKIKSILR